MLQCQDKFVLHKFQNHKILRIIAVTWKIQTLSISGNGVTTMSETNAFHIKILRKPEFCWARKHIEYAGIAI